MFRCIFKLFLAVFIFFCSNVVFAAEKEPFNLSDLFDKIDNKTDYIQSIHIDVKISDVATSTTATLAVKSPDKFAIIFADGSNKVTFDGKTLWLYIGELNEVFYHSFGDNSMFGSYISYLYPGSLFKKLTKATLLAIFDVSPVRIINNEDGSKFYVVNFVPKFESLAKRVFTICNYHVYFSDKNWLPEKVLEINSDGTIKNTLNVLNYKINDEIKDEFFVYTKTEGVVTMPLVLVIAEKFELYLENMADDVTNFLGF